MYAYDILYYEDICDLQEMIFQEITRYKYELDYDKFVEGYMNCKYRRLLDRANPRVSNMTWDEYMCYLERDCGEIFVPGETDIDILKSGWIGRIYSMIQFKMNIPSSEIYQKLPIDRMRVLFRPLHTVSEDVAVDKLIKIILGEV